MKIKILGKTEFQDFPIVEDMIEIDDDIISRIGVDKCFDVDNNCVIDYNPDEDIEVIKVKNENRIAELKDYLNNTWSWQMERYNAEKAEMELGIRVEGNFTISLENLIISRKKAVDEINKLEEEIKKM